MTAHPSYETIASDLEAQVHYLLRRVLVAEGKDPEDLAAMRELLADVEAAEPYTLA